MHPDIASRLNQVKGNIRNARMNINQLEEGVRLIAVSKLKSNKVIQEAYSLGIRDFGENYAQELAIKAPECPEDIIWHFMGPIQTNKIKLIAEHAHWVHSLDRQKVANKLNAACEHLNKNISVLIQVNIDNEFSKSGIQSEDVINFAKDIDAHCPNLDLEGLMFMPNINAGKKDKLETLENIKSLRQLLLDVLPRCSELSLGTSGDYEDAIIAGSSMVRIGETLLGSRS